jgi:hypothetical protein
MFEWLLKKNDSSDTTPRKNGLNSSVEDDMHITYFKITFLPTDSA